MRIFLRLGCTGCGATHLGALAEGLGSFCLPPSQGIELIVQHKHLGSGDRLVIA